MSWRTATVEGGYQRLLRPILFRARGGDPEKIHEDMIAALAALAHVPGLRDAVRGLTRVAAEPVEVAGSPSVAASASPRAWTRTDAPRSPGSISASRSPSSAR